MLESLFFGFSLAISSHLAVQCDNICFVMLDTVILLTVVLLHILNHFFIQFSRCDLLLSQLVGSNGLEPSTSRLSGVRSNHLSYEPVFVAVRVAIPANLLSSLCKKRRLAYAFSVLVPRLLVF